MILWFNQVLGISWSLVSKSNEWRIQWIGFRHDLLMRVFDGTAVRHHDFSTLYAGVKRGNLVVLVVERSDIVPTQTQVQGEVARQFPLVLAVEVIIRIDGVEAVQSRVSISRIRDPQQEIGETTASSCRGAG